MDIQAYSAVISYLQVFLHYQEKTNLFCQKSCKTVYNDALKNVVEDIRDMNLFSDTFDTAVKTILCVHSLQV